LHRSINSVLFARRLNLRRVHDRSTALADPILVSALDAANPVTMKTEAMSQRHRPAWWDEIN